MLPAKIEKHGINSLGKEQRIRHSNLGESKKKKKAEDKRQNPGIQAGESREAVAAKSPRNNSDSPPRVHKVPLSSDARHSSFRRDENKTDKRYGNSLDAQETEVTSLSAPRDQVLVRETKTSRLRAAGRNYDGGTPPSKLPSSDKKVKVSSDSSTQILLHKIVDKSHTRKSNVNRSNICADATTTSSLPGISELRRSHTKNISNICSKSQIVKSKEENSSLDFSLASSNLSKPAALITNCRNQKCLTDRDISKSAKCVETRKSQHCRKPTSDISDSPTSKDEGDRPSTSKSNSGKSCDATASPTTMDTSTSKLITHLDNTKTRKNNSQKNPRRNVQENIKKLLPLNPVIHSLSRSGDVKKQNIKVGTKKVEQSLFENYGNASRTQKSSMLINSQQPSVSVAPQQSSSSDGTNAGKTSILKSKRISSSGTPLREVQKSKPISILKRKSATHEETLADSPPVTFSSLTLEKENDPKKQGILKKRRSLDENYVLKRHSSPDAILTDFKSILKRSSMEDLTLRSCSPDSYVLQGILKRKYSKEEEPEVSHASGNLVEPHSILKRKWPSSNAQQHLLPDVGDYQSCENVRPILKKKSSEEQNTSDPLLPEVPRSILKKKSGLENEEIDEKPKRPILKSCRLPSAEDSEIEPPLDMEPVKPILKMDISCHRHTEEFEISGCQVNPERSHSSGQMKLSVELQRKSSSSECNLHSLSIQKFRMEDRGHTADPGGCEEKRQTKAKSLTYPKVETKPLDAIISDNTSQESIQKDTIVSVICAPENTSDETEASRSVENQMISLGCFNMEEEREITKKTGNGSAIEEESNMSAEEEKERKLTGGSRAYIRRRNEKRISNTKKQRFHTQPISSEDIKLSLSGNRVQKEQKAEDEKYEDELSCLSYAERLRLFESTVTAPTLPRMSKSDGKPRGLRFRTQPVTTIEVEKAKSQRTTCLAECLDSKREPTATDPKELERSKVETDASSYLNLKFKENLGAILKSTRDNSETGRSERNKSSVSNEEEGKLESWRTTTTGKKPGSQFLNEMNNILKPLPALQKSRSKGGYSSEVPETRSVSSIIRRAQQVAACLEKKKTNERQGTSEVLEKDNVSFDRSTKSSNNSSIVKSQSHSAVPSNKDSFNLLRRDNPDEVDEPRSRKGPGELRTSTTQPFKTTDTSNDNDMSGASIQERLARLKKNGELSWQKRKSHVINVEDEISVITTGNYLLKESLLRSSVESPKSRIDLPKPGGELRSSILSDRLEQLGAAQSGWKKRVQPSDAVRFSVEGMLLENSEVSPAASAIPAAVARKKRSPKALKFRSRYAVDKSPSVEQSEELRKKIESEKHAASIRETTEEIGPVVTVPKIDDETFTSFFNGALDLRETWNERLELRDEDLDVIAKMKSSQLLVQKRNIKTQRRRATVQNPVKALSTRFQFQEYTEIKTGAAQKELRRLRLESGETNSNLAIEALAGLASQEDFTAVTLKKASEGGTQSPDAPYKDLMLLQIKGRRHIQTRLVEPVASNINIGDCFVLVTGNKVFHYVGKYANVIERSRGAEIAMSIQQRGDLGCTAESVVTIGESGRATRKETEEFWTLLGGRPENERGAGSLDEDEIFESCLVDTNKVYQVVDQEMVPVDSYWGAIPKIDVLDPNKILVFDFGSELYVWNGKNVNLTDRKEALKLAREFWDEGYDYSECSLCPLTVATYMGSPIGSEVPDCNKSGPIRPSWALFAKITQNMETVLFREKFLDWPDYSRVIQKNKKNESTTCDGNGITDLKPCDAKEMLENSVPEPDMVLEGSHLGRGVTYYDEETRRCSEITTQEVIVWHISEYEHTEIPATSVGQFHMGDSYVVRWHYTVTITGRELGGQPSKHITTGRDRYAYFCWQGQDSPINDKGAAACLTVELDKENGPQVRVVQGFEPPVFLNLFKGTMVVHRGKRFLNDECPTWRLYICRGEVETESVLFEVPCSMRQLRSVASFLLVNNRKGMLIVWHGYHSCEHSRKVILSAVRQIQKNKPLEFGFSSESIEVREEEEGRESSELLDILGADNRQLYCSFLNNETFKVTTPRLFHLTSISGQFQSMEIASPYLNKEVTTPLPFVQADLYSASQPALFLLDTGTCLWLWQGWKDDSLETDRGSGNHRFQAERRAAMSTTLDYWAHKYGTSGTIRAYLIWAGLEPLVFTNQFPFWTDRDDVAEINMKDGKKPGEIVQVEKELESLTQSFYNLSELQNRPLPDGVNPSLLEDYLKPECFQEVFGLDRNDFFTLPSWKKKKLKQEAGLF